MTLVVPDRSVYIVFTFIGHVVMERSSQRRGPPVAVIVMLIEVTFTECLQRQLTGVDEELVRHPRMVHIVDGGRK